MRIEKAVMISFRPRPTFLTAAQFFNAEAIRNVFHACFVVYIYDDRRPENCPVGIGHLKLSPLCYFSKK